MEKLCQGVVINGTSASTTYESGSSPNDSPFKQCNTPYFKESPREGTAVTQTNQALEAGDKSPTLSLLKSLFNGVTAPIQGKSSSNSPSFAKKQVSVAPCHECFRDETQIMYCVGCKRFICGLCHSASGNHNKHSENCEGLPKHLPEVSLEVVKNFSGQLDQIRNLKLRLDKLRVSDPFELNQSEASTAASTLTTHNKIYKQGSDLIENVFSEIKSHLNKVQADFKKSFKEQLIRIYQSKMKQRTSSSYEQLTKLEEYVAYVNDELSLLRQRGKHQVLSKAYPKLEELETKVQKIESDMLKQQRRSHKFVQQSDIQISWRQDILSRMTKQMLLQCVRLTVLGDPDPKVVTNAESARAHAETIIAPNYKSFQQCPQLHEIESGYKQNIMSQIFQPSINQPLQKKS